LWLCAQKVFKWFDLMEAETCENFPQNDFTKAPTTKL
jgi:hypothetical protein